MPAIEIIENTGRENINACLSLTAYYLTQSRILGNEIASVSATHATAHCNNTVE